MALPPLLTLKDISLTFGGSPLFEKLSLTVTKGSKICLVGRNGSGKSTLLKILAGLVEKDEGTFYKEPGVQVAYLSQDVDVSYKGTLLDYICQTTTCEQFEAEAVLEALKMPPQWEMVNLSGGERRRVALAQTVVKNPDVLLLDEPTNHLDLPTIEWLEQQLNAFKGAVITISHDRRFLEKVSTSTVWLDRGCLHVHNKGFEDFDQWSGGLLAEEERQLERLDSKLKLETAWLHRGVTARRKRNQGRLHKLHDLRDQRRLILSNKTAKMNMTSAQGDLGSKLVVEAKAISKSYGDKKLVTDFSTRILRGDRIGIIGPNGAGKSTLARMLVGQLMPDEGLVTLGKTVQLIYFDQLRDSLNPTDTLWGTLCEGGGDHVMIRGTPRHVVAYLKDFLFSEKQALSPISVLSGGEKNRLTLAKALTQPGNFLVLDEPTNDLDMDTLDLLQEMLSDYEGTLLIVSHDRDFLDKLTLSLIAVEGDGQAQEYVGGYEDYLRQRIPPSSKKEKPMLSSKAKPVSHKQLPSRRLGYNEKREYGLLPKEIEKLGADIKQAEQKIENPTFYSAHPQEFTTLSQWLTKAYQDLETKELRWLELAELLESS